MSLAKRKIELQFNNETPRHWANGESFVSHWLNAYTVLIPDGERFILRTCRQFENRVSARLKTEIKGLYYQEGQHSLQHKKALALLEQQGYRVNWFKSLTSFFCYRLLEPVFPAVFALSTASAIEHVNALIAEHFLRKNNFFEHSDKTMGKMFAWHFAEEIEHKCVVYDTLNEINGNWLLRLFGLVTCWLTFVNLLYLATFIFAFQDGSVFTPKFWKGFFRFNFREKFLARIIQGSFVYLKSAFHPKAMANEHLVAHGMALYQTLKGQ